MGIPNQPPIGQQAGLAPQQQQGGAVFDPAMLNQPAQPPTDPNSPGALLFQQLQAQGPLAAQPPPSFGAKFGPDAGQGGIIPPSQTFPGTPQVNAAGGGLNNNFSATVGQSFPGAQQPAVGQNQALPIGQPNFGSLLVNQPASFAPIAGPGSPIGIPGSGGTGGTGGTGSGTIAGGIGVGGAGPGGTIGGELDLDLGQGGAPLESARPSIQTNPGEINQIDVRTDLIKQLEGGAFGNLMSIFNNPQGFAQSLTQGVGGVPGQQNFKHGPAKSRCF